MLTYVASIPLSTRSLTRLSELIRGRRAVLRGRWRLPAHEQALMTLAHLRNGDTLTRLAAGFAVSVSTVWRYLREAIDLLAGHAWDLARGGGSGRPAGLREGRRHRRSGQPGLRRREEDQRPEAVHYHRHGWPAGHRGRPGRELAGPQRRQCHSARRLHGHP